MRNLIAAVVTAMVLAVVLPANAQDNAAKTDTTGIKIVHDTNWKAGFYSRDNKALVVHIRTGKKEKLYTAEQYAAMLYEMFLDTARTPYPMAAVFYVENSEDDHHSVTMVFMNGIKFDKNGGQYWDGDDMIHPYDLPGFIRQITSRYASMNGWPMD